MQHFASACHFDGFYDTVDIFHLKADGTFERTQTLQLSQGRYYLAATSVGDYALFGGGYNGNEHYNAVEIFHLKGDGTFERTQTLQLSQERSHLAAASIGDYALFGGGYGGGNYSDTVDIFHLKADGTFELVQTLQLSQGRGYLAATSVGNYALFGGGYNEGNRFDTVEIFHYNDPSTRKRISISGIKHDDIAIVMPKLSDDIKTAQKELEEWSKVFIINTLDDAIEVTCFGKAPSVPINIQLKR